VFPVRWPLDPGFGIGIDVASAAPSARRKKEARLSPGFEVTLNLRVA
jgi:hypothetical protein